MKRKPPLHRFQDYSNQGAADACWVWIGPTQSAGYGVMIWSEGGQRNCVLAHRFAYEQHHGRPVPRDLKCCHRCDTPLCVNPTHLFLGTQADNLADMAIKGRSNLGVKNPRAKLTEEQVKEIRGRLSKGAIPNAIARELGMNRQSIYWIRDRRNWKHIS